MPSLEPRLTQLVGAFATNERIETAIRQQQKRDVALARLGDDVHEQRAQLAQEIRAFLHDAV